VHRAFKKNSVKKDMFEYNTHFFTLDVVMCFLVLRISPELRRDVSFSHDHENVKVKGK